MFTKRFILLINLILFLLLIECLSKPIDTNRINYQYVNSKQIEDNNWFINLIINLLGYSLILFPSALIVFLVKNDLCLKSVRENSFIKLFVFGRNESIINYTNNESEQKLLPLSLNETKDPFISPKTRKIYLLMYCFLGLQISYLSWGLLQEKIMTTEYEIESDFFAFHKQISIAENLVTISSLRKKLNVDTHDEHKNLKEDLDELNKDTKQTYRIKFRNSQFLVLINRILAFLVAFSAIMIKNRNKMKNMQLIQDKSEPPLHQYIYCSLSNILSSWCQYEALKFVSFPTQVLSKACKLLPVMVMSQIIGGKRYRTIEYLFAISISLGMTLFLWSDHDLKSRNISVDSNSTTIDASKHYSGGLLILILYLTFDSFTSNWQGILFDKYKMSTFDMMAAVNFFSILLTSTSLTQQGDLTPAFQLVFHNKSMFTDCLLLSIFSASGQLFVFYTISNFGALVFVTIMTLRQAIAILLSCLVYDHSLAPIGLIGIVIVFGTLFTQIYWKSSNKNKR